MGRSPCCDKVGLKKGPWTPEEDQKLLAYIEEQGHGSWRALPAKAGLQRCGKSCRLRWTNYLRPDIKRGKFNLQEEQTIIQLHALLGNRWSAIATHLPKRTDNEIKNYWNTHLKKRLARMGIDPVTHKPKCDALGSVEGQVKNAANLSHMAQWESARLEAEARLVRESQLRSQASHPFPPTSSLPPLKQPPSPPSLDVFKAWQWQSQGGGVWSTPNKGGPAPHLQSPTSTLSFSENGKNSTTKIESSSAEEVGGGDWKGFGNPTRSAASSADDEDMVLFPTTTAKPPSTPPTGSCFDEGFTDLLLHNSEEDDENNYNNNSEEEEEEEEGEEEEDEDDDDDAKNYWNNILNLVNSSPSSNSPLF